MNHCPACMGELRGFVRYCPECGTPIGAAAGEAQLPADVVKQTKSDFRALWYLLPVLILIVVLGGVGLMTGGGDEEAIIGGTVGLVGLVSGLTMAVLWWRRRGQGPQTPGRVIGNVVLGTVIGIAGGIATIMVLGFIAIIAAVLFLLVVCSRGC